MDTIWTPASILYRPPPPHHQRFLMAAEEKRGVFLRAFWSQEDYYCFVNTFKYEKEKVILDKYTIIEKSRKRVVSNWLQYYSVESLINEFEANGFNIEHVFSDVSGKAYTPDSKEMAIVVKTM